MANQVDVAEDFVGDGRGDCEDDHDCAEPVFAPMNFWSAGDEGQNIASNQHFLEIAGIRAEWKAQKVALQKE